ncbi:hypothetical protein ACP70R_001547 [Stipagrostis hirtigluma subsp. patula]
MAASRSTTASSSPVRWMDRRLLEAATSGDAASMKHLALHDPAVLLGTTLVGNTCLHISCIHGHEGFSMDVVVLNRCLLAAVITDNETVLLTAVTSGHASLASFLLRQLAMELIAAEPALSRAVNKYDESPMFIAVVRNYADIFEKLLEIPDSAHGGTYGHNALHAAVRNGNAAFTKEIVETRPMLAREESKQKATPMHFAVVWNKIDVLRVLLKHDSSLGYVVNTDSVPLLCSAAFRGHVDAARELLRHCPDAPYCDSWTCLHNAVHYGQVEFVKCVLGT